MNRNDFIDVSMIGRAAYAVMCAEKYAVTKYPDRNWKPLFNWMWELTSDYFDEWYYRFMEILPEYLYEFDNYKDANFEYLTEEDYDYYSSFLKDIDSNMSSLLEIPAKISMVYCYMPIPGRGNESIDLLLDAARILEENGIEPPDTSAVAFSSFSEKDGWGEPFDGSRLSVVLR